MLDIDFRRIVPRCGSKNEAFEEFCCQLARRTVSEKSAFFRLHGAGGDGGVECYADLPDGSRIGWQAKYVFTIDSLLKHATKSLLTALQIHPSLNKYVLCFPFDLTGPTSRYGQSGVEKFESWRKNQIQLAHRDGRRLEIDEWPANKMLSLLMDLDVSGGISQYFFDETILTSNWFSNHITTATHTAGPRYTPQLNVRTEVSRWFSAFGRTSEWNHELDSLCRAARKKGKRFGKAIRERDGNPIYPAWPEILNDEGQSVYDAMQDTLNTLDILNHSFDIRDYKLSLSELDNILSKFSTLENELLRIFENQYGPNQADSPSFRQYMAEHLVSFPTANIDVTKEARETLCELHHWLKSPAGTLAFSPAFVLSGTWGVGKTHIVCDAATLRLDQQLLSCVIFGHQFGNAQDIWTRLADILGVSLTLGRNNLLDALNTAATASGAPLILFIDGINETRPLHYWRNRIRPLVDEIGKRSHLRVCFTCRSPYLDNCLPDSHLMPIVEHRGFKGAEHVASAAFFEHYGLKPPVAPILQPEFSNPLYLRLVCETLKSSGKDQIPSGWSSTSHVILAFLKMKECEFANDHGMRASNGIVADSLRCIAKRIANLGVTRLRQSEANNAILKKRPETVGHNVVNWLIGACLLIEEAPETAQLLDTENTVRLAFERLGDFLIASELLLQLGDNASIDSVFTPEGKWHAWVQDTVTIEENHGILSALSIMVPEEFRGTELPLLPARDEVRNALYRIAVNSIPWRDAAYFSFATRDVLLEALNNSDLHNEAMDSLLSVSWRPSAIDSVWLHNLLEPMSLASRDGHWCTYLYRSYEKSGPTRRLIDAVFSQRLDLLDEEVAERWAIVLLWFTAAADRRVKDWATRSVVRILSIHSALTPRLLDRFLHVNDDAVRERLLLASYGSLIISRDENTAKYSALTLQNKLLNQSIEFDNALIRDHMRCISELTQKLTALPDDIEPMLSMQPIGSKWPLELPSEDDLKEWGDLIHFIPNEFRSDFYKYSMSCLRPWAHKFTKDDMGKWIVQRVARDFDYGKPLCINYDNYMLAHYGGGRGKPVWVERIGKKYQWIAMYQLASRLHDHVKREKISWHPETIRTPLILLEERQLDPTIPAVTSTMKQTDPWWIGTARDVDMALHLSDDDWVARKNDLPTLEEILSARERDRQYWRVLVAYLSWGGRDEDLEWGKPYRHVWMHITGYLVRKEDFSIARDCLHERNFYGRWMPRGVTWLYGFVGEYPWATPFNTDRQDWNGYGTGTDTLPVAFQPSWNEIAGEWEYDASLPKEYDASLPKYNHILAPTRQLFAPMDLWWDGRDGYRLSNGTTVYRDPSSTEEYGKTLIGDVEDLRCRLDDLGLRFVWTVLGEKLIAGDDRNRRSLRRTFSQTATMRMDGSLNVGRRVFFEDYNQDVGPRAVNNG